MSMRKGLRDRGGRAPVRRRGARCRQGPRVSKYGRARCRRGALDRQRISNPLLGFHKTCHAIEIQGRGVGVRRIVGAERPDEASEAPGAAAGPSASARGVRVALG